METPRSDQTHTNATSRTASIGSGEYNHAQAQPDDYLDLPIREINDGADLREYITETRTGEIIKPVKSNATGKIEDWKMVTFTIDDPENPKNWSKAYKWYCTMVVAFTCFVVAFCSSVITADIEGPIEEFGIGREVSLLVITVFVIGFGLGPMVFAPMSEIFGRRPVYALTLAIAVIFVIPCAVSKNIGTLIVCRLIDGIAFSAPMTLVGGTLADLWKSEERGVPMAAFSAAPFIGPAIGPLVGGYLADNCGWRWLYWIQLIMAFVAWVMITFTVPETFAPILLKKRAQKLRKSQDDPKYTTETELDARPMGEKLRIFLFRPFQLLFLEPIVLFISLYMSVIYGLLYMFFVAYPIVYQGGKGWSASNTGLMFIPLAIGVVMSAACAPFVNMHYLKVAAACGGKPPAEKRLLPMMCACWCIPSGLFVFAWTSYPDLHWMGPAMGGFLIGFGIIFLYNSANNYLVDTYQHQAASALAAKTFIRSIWGACTVLFTEQMYERLGDQWASSLLAFIGLGCCAIPYVFYFKGESIRRFSKFAFSDDEENAVKA
ncbi:Major facilitator superfamily domain general substrate transporter [Penicillium cf. griseofulvum]|uniref:Major facilitator superfamily domain general substrate transporter n=1 Tax=Penicillium cf. griseofulvum TaxID=2972120 RepID=A0A9W9MEJ7_9EURO|nr:Major facilitator superfamily domain general substrate transporter [Penicillium cf. griseofulvum]KAJ5451313.1 Major facilitator superfamily domain general substrate transporter [Penicillium cf. griseofulvum]